ncbi:flagellin [Sporomusa sphaeroides]|uniref:Flagellin n=1 Tax=Sporomusa sphaeroides DSM 2875 TaxID=1337886 RepID=A0ABM9W952_9FIRM|nr:flagellin [Sporomusa sphaeroides]OLS54226.1 flagellin [Sporomusa sphaeroides DSM 2875]CVK21624.1 Flagellin [Sporomusa sphaeroides DSM 2875]
MIIHTNISGLNAFRELYKNERKSSKSLEKLSSGLRINKAADDAAGLSISEKMRAQIRGLSQAARNIQDAINYMDTVDGSLGNIHTPPLERLRELAVQAANDTLTKSDREAIQAEVVQIQEHLRKLFRSAEFNTSKIFAQNIREIKTAIPGILPGDTVIREYGLRVAAGQNDTLTFRLDGVEHSISLPPKATAYTADELVETLNMLFAGAGTDITVDFEGDSLVYYSPTKVLDSLGGNMIEINAPDAWTSIIYDNSKPGSIFGADIQGYEVLTDGAVIDSLHTKLTFRVGGDAGYQDVLVNFAEGSYTAQEIVDTLNAAFAADYADVTAKLDSGGRLLISHNKRGAKYTLTNLGGTARTVILDQLSSTTHSESRYAGSNGYAAAFKGNKSLAGGVTIEAGRNDVLRFNVGGTGYEVTLAAGTYTQDGIIDQLNEVFTAKGITAQANLSGSVLQLAYTGAGSGSIGTVSGGAAYALMGGAGSVSVSQGSYKLEEGNSTPIATGRATASGTTRLTNGAQIVTGYNDTLTFRLDGEDKVITLGGGWYTGAGLLAAIKSGLSGMDITARYDSYDRLIFEHKNAGGGIPLFPYSLDNFGGNALSTLMSTDMPIGQAYGGSPAASQIIGAANVSNVTISTGVNDSLTVRVNDADHVITLAAGTYNQTTLVAELNNKFASEGIGSAIVVSASSSALRISSRTAGTATQLNAVAGNSVNTLFRREVSHYNYAYVRMPSASDTYIDGRVDLQQGIAIATGVNDKLSFDIHNGSVVERKTVTLDAGDYTADGLIAMVNAKLQAQNPQVAASGKKVETPQNTKTVLTLTYSPGVDGIFAIDGVGGSAAYTVFYPGPYDLRYDGGENIRFQVGANSGNMLAAGTQLVMNLKILGLEQLDMTKRGGASQAIEAVDEAVAMVSAARGLIGAKRNALDSLYRNVTQSGENLQAAESKIRDVNMAKELAEYAKLAVLAQASTAMLSQANKQPQMILELLK